MRTKLAALLAGSSLLALVSPALAQPAPAAPAAAAEDDDSGDDDGEIVVTGTMIRGVAPTGAQPVTLDEEAITASGADSSAQLLATIPQLSDFGFTPATFGQTNVQLSVNRPNIRNLPGNNGGTSPTLLLMDGHRLPGAGIRQASADSDVIPPSAIERVEVVPDGGSAIYGSDAVGGVVNYITRSRFDGVQVSSSISAGESYEGHAASIIAGEDWGSGSAYIAYNHSYNDAMYGRDLDWVQRRNWTTGLLLDTTCSPGTFSVAGTPYALPGAVANTTNRCDTSDDAAFYPESERDSFLGSFMQELGADLTFNLTAYYTRRDSMTDPGPFTATNQNVPTTNAWYQSIGPGGAQSATFSYGNAIGGRTQTTTLEVWGVTPTLTWDLPHEWQVRLLGNYGEGASTYLTPQINTANQTSALSGALSGSTATALNPYNPSLTSPTTLALIADQQLYGRGDHELANGRLVFDGPLFALPGGEVRVAFGAEYINEHYATGEGTTARGREGDVRTSVSGGRDVSAYFGEINVPFVGEGNRLPGIESLTLSAAVRFDDYSDFGETANPRIGLSYEPLDWITLRGNWGTSFQAPALPSILSPPSVTVFNGFNPIVNPSVAATPGSGTVVMMGGFPDLDPQTAETLSYGIDIRPPFLSDFDFSITHYSIEYEGQVSPPPVQNAPLFFSSFPDLYFMNPTPADLLSLTAGASNQAAALASVVAPTYLYIDFRSRNLSTTRVAGWDFTANYNHDTDFGSVFGSLNGTWRTVNELQTLPTSPFIDQVDQSARLNGSISLGANIGNFTALATVQYSGPFDVAPVAANDFQQKVHSFTVLNTFFRYNFEGEGLRNDLSVTLNIDNVLDEDPAEYRGVFGGFSAGFANQRTFGRVFRVGLTKTF